MRLAKKDGANIMLYSIIYRFFCAGGLSFVSLTSWIRCVRRYNNSRTLSAASLLSTRLFPARQRQVALFVGRSVHLFEPIVPIRVVGWWYPRKGRWREFLWTLLQGWRRNPTIARQKRSIRKSSNLRRVAILSA